GSAIAYSLGNFCFDDVYTDKSAEPLIRQSLNNRQGAILEIEVEGGTLLWSKLTPLFAGDDKLEIGSTDIEARIRQYSASLERVDVKYEARRNAMSSTYFRARKQSRDLEWYLKRMNLNSVGILLRALYNRSQYRKNVLSF